ncbi:MAG: thioredoxin-dependent thiol peroxidase [Pseudomonadota bacterium]
MTDTPMPGDAAPDFSLPAEDGRTLSLADFAGKKLVLFFYPKADTSGCTKEAVGFTEAIGAFEAAGAAVVGVSKDPVTKQGKFVSKHDLKTPLLSDEAGDLCERYGVWVEKSMYGKKYMGIERSTFLIGPDGKIAEAWRKVKVPGHVDTVLKATETM